LVEAEIDPLGNKWTFEYDANQHRTRAEDPLGNAWTYAYDKTGRLLSRTDPNGNTVTIKYDEQGRQAGFVDAQDRAWPLHHDPSGRLATLLDPESNSVKLEYSSRGDLSATIDEVGRRTSYLYDHAGNMVERRNTRGLVVKREYDFKGQLLREIDSLGVRLQLEYDQLGRVKVESARDRGVLLYEHDAQGNITKVTDVFGETTVFEYGCFNKVLRRKSPGGAVTIQDYDSENRLKAVTYPGGRRSENGYDADGRIIWKRTVDGRKLEYVRNPAGFVTAVHDAAGIIASYEHDGVGRIIRKVTADGEEATFEYDVGGRLVGANNKNAEVMFKYDPCGRVTGEVGPNGAVTREFDPAGRLTKSSFSEGLTCTLSREDGAETLITDTGLVRSEYDLYGRLECLKFPNGAMENYRYQSSRRPEGTVRNGNEIQYEYDAAGCLTAIMRSHKGKRWFTRDVQRRLVASTRNGSEPSKITSFQYDSQGNRSRGGEGFSFTSGNRLVSTSQETLNYDIHGRLAERCRRNGVRTEYRYSAEGLLTEVLQANIRISFRYDALGRRVSKIVDGEETRYGWEGSRLIHEWRPNGEERNYIYRINSFMPLVCQRRQSGNKWEAFFFHNDHRGCPESVTNALGQEVWRADIGPFGEVEHEEGEFDEPLALPGQYRDVESGLVYNYRRYFDPHLTIFITPDPLGHVAGEQLYAFAADPITKVDPLGLSDADYDNTKVTPHRIVTINGVKYVEFDAADAFSSPNPMDPNAMPNVNLGGSGVGPDGSPDTLAQIGPNGEVVVFEGRHRAVSAAAGDEIPESAGGVPGKPGHLRYELSDNEADPADIGPRLSDMAADPDTLKAARSGHPSQRTT
jgi:RHS repeat-associated protein